MSNDYNELEQNAGATVNGVPSDATNTMGNGLRPIAETEENGSYSLEEEQAAVREIAASASGYDNNPSNQYGNGIEHPGQNSTSGYGAVSNSGVDTNGLSYSGENAGYGAVPNYGTTPNYGTASNPGGTPGWGNSSNNTNYGNNTNYNMPNNMGFDLGAERPDMAGKTTKKAKKKKGGFVVACIAFMVLGVLVGCGAAIGLSKFEVLDKLNIGTRGVIEESDEAELDEEELYQEDATLTVDDEEALADEAASEDASEEENTEVKENKKAEKKAEKKSEKVQNANDDLLAGDTASGSNMSVAQIAEKCMPCVVAITNKGVTEVRSMWGNFKQESESSGSGVIIGETDTELLILTNYHVIESAQELSVVFSFEEGEDASSADIKTAQIKDYDQRHDIAVIAIPLSNLNSDILNKIVVASIGDSNEIVLGEQVVAIGNALGYGQSVTTGIVSAMNRAVAAESYETIGSANKYIQTDAAINPGNSGGALFNMKGELIGINSAKIASSSVEGMGYAIPITDILQDVQFMMEEETKVVVDESKRGYLGISVIDVTQEVSATYGLPIGVYVNEVNAEDSALEKGDIITGLDGKKISSVEELKNYLSYYEVGETVTVTVSRTTDDGYQSTNVEVVLVKNKEAERPKTGKNAGTPQTEELQPDIEDEIEEYDEYDGNGGYNDFSTYQDLFDMFGFGDFFGGQ